MRPANVRAVTTMTSPPATAAGVGGLLRQWRERRRLSQLDLAIQADISARHLSFVETGRSRPSPDMIVRLSEQLDVPLRERNAMLLAGGYAPAHPQPGPAEPELEFLPAALRPGPARPEPDPPVGAKRPRGPAGTPP